MATLSPLVLRTRVFTLNSHRHATRKSIRILAASAFAFQRTLASFRFPFGSLCRHRAAVSLISPFLPRLGSPSTRSTRGTSRRANLVAPNTVITAWLANLHLVAHVLLVSLDARATRRFAARRVFSAVPRPDSVLNASLLCRGDKHNTTRPTRPDSLRSQHRHAQST